MSMFRLLAGAPPSPRLAQALNQEETAGLAFAFRLRVIALALVAHWLVAIVPMPRLLYYLGLVALFLLLGALPLLLARRGKNHLL